MYMISKDDLKKSLLLVPPNHKNACRGSDMAGDCICRRQIDYFTHTVVPPLKMCIMCMIYILQIDMIRVAAEFRRSSLDLIRDDPTSVVYNFVVELMEGGDQFIPFDYTTFPLNINPMIVAPSVPVMCNTCLLFPDINTFMQQDDPSKTPLCRLTIDMEDEPTGSPFFSPPFDMTDSPMLSDPLVLVSEECTPASFKHILNTRFASLCTTSPRYNSMTSSRAISLLGSLAMIESACNTYDSTAPMMFIAAMGDPITQTPVHYHWRSCIPPIIVYSCLGCPISSRWSSTIPTFIISQHQPAKRIIDPHFAKTVIMLLVDPWKGDDDDADLLSMFNIKTWSHGLLLDIIVDYHISKRVAMPFDVTDIACNPTRYMTVNILRFVANAVRRHPMSEHLPSMPLHFHPQTPLKVFNIIASGQTPVYSRVSFCPTCNVAGICILDGNKHVRQRSLITLLVDPIWCAFICDSCGSRCAQINVTDNIIAPVVSAHFIESVVATPSTNSILVPNRASLQMNQVCIAMSKSDENRYQIRTNGVYINSKFKLLSVDA
jgi:hypothetical protein